MAGLFIDHIVMRGDELQVVGKTAGVPAVSVRCESQGRRFDAYIYVDSQSGRIAALGWYSLDP